jgi:hypothetical protein
MAWPVQGKNPPFGKVGKKSPFGEVGKETHEKSPP